MMLGQLDASPGDRVLEIGAGTGYNDGQDGERTGHITPDVALYWDTDQPIDPTSLQEVFAQPKVAVWSGATVVANEPFDGIWLRLTGAEPGTCRFAWGHDRTAQPLITAYPAGTPNEDLPNGGVVIDKQYIRLVVSI